jgi:DNA helicase II / ATP-dependent DNA helicase PcrA
MDNVLSTLNNEQIEAVKTTEGPLLVLSGAGTGKTRVLVERIGHIIDNGCAKEYEILALTFTNKAANEMKSRLLERLPPVNCEWCGTFHSICLKILRRNYAAANIRHDFIIFGEDDQKAALKSVILSMGLDIKKFPPSDWVEKIGFYKDTFLNSDKKMSDEFNKIYTAYNTELDRLNALDFGDIINRTIQLLETSPNVLEKYKNQFKYILVDEYQDTNVMQNKLLRLLSNGNICCVGDDDQSIYSWRGAEIKNILHFSREYPDAKIIRLEKNYRSTGNILAAANSLIKNNRSRLGKDLHPTIDDGDKIRVIECASDLEEAMFISQQILSEHTAYSDFAVLIRSGSLSRVIEEEFARNSIPYKLIGAQKFYDRAEVKDVIAYIRLLCYPFDDISFLRILPKPRRGIGDTTIEQLKTFARTNGLSLFDALKKFPMKQKQAVAALDFLNAFDFNWQNMQPVDATEMLLDKSGYTKMWNESDDVNKEERQKNIRELLRGVIAKFDTLTDFIENVSLMTANDDNNDDNTVSIMTIHAAKGLEFNTVFLPAWEDGIFPNEMSLSENGLEEERRLAYVAITRAKRHCFIITAFSRLQFGTFQHNPPSRFIDEIDESLLEFPARLYRQDKQAPKPKIKISNTVGKMIKDPEFGMGVIIEDQEHDYIVAFKTGIKKIRK